LLSWLIRNVELPVGKSEADVGEERRELIARNPKRIEQALGLLGMNASAKAWYILEGKTCPDVFIATEDIVVVIEGKRTEPGPTTSTTWMTGRHQMLRHLDAAFEVLGNRLLFGFFIVEGGREGGLPPAWVNACRETLSPAVAQGSLPHRPQAERTIISEAFLGATTWQQVCSTLGVNYTTLPDEVVV
jgi:hypothetical protein